MSARSLIASRVNGFVVSQTMPVNGRIPVEELPALVQSHHSLVRFPHAQEQDARRPDPLIRLISAFHLEFVAGDQRHSTPGNDGDAEQIHRWGRHSAPCAFLNFSSNLRAQGPTSALYDPPKELMKLVAVSSGVGVP